MPMKGKWSQYITTVSTLLYFQVVFLICVAFLRTQVKPSLDTLVSCLIFIEFFISNILLYHSKLRLVVSALTCKEFGSNHTHFHNKKTCSGEPSWISHRIEIGQKNSLRLNQNIKLHNIMEISDRFKNDFLM